MGRGTPEQKKKGSDFRAALLCGAAGLAFFSDCYRYPDEIDQALYELRITEIQYNPVDTAGFPSDSLEFIELKNVGTVAIDLSTCSFTEGIEYVFPKGAHVDPGGFYVIASSRNGFNAAYGFYPDGVFEKRLSNSTDTIVLTDDYTELAVLTQSYEDGSDWPAEADGQGHSIVPVAVDPPRNPTGPQEWRRSVGKYGSPGRDDILQPRGESLNDLRVTEILLPRVGS